MLRIKLLHPETSLGILLWINLEILPQGTMKIPRGALEFLQTFFLHVGIPPKILMGYPPGGLLTATPEVILKIYSRDSRKILRNFSRRTFRSFSSIFFGNFSNNYFGNFHRLYFMEFISPPVVFPGVPSCFLQKFRNSSKKIRKLFQDFFKSFRRVFRRIDWWFN